MTTFNGSWTDRYEYKNLISEFREVSGLVDKIMSKRSERENLERFCREVIMGDHHDCKGAGCVSCLDARNILNK